MDSESDNLTLSTVRHSAVACARDVVLKVDSESDNLTLSTVRHSVTIRFHDSHNIVLGSDGYLYILSHFGCLPNASLDWPV